MSRTSKPFPLLLGALLLTSACHGPLRPGLNALAEGNYPKAEKHARSGLKKDSKDPELNLLLADALVGEERYREAFPYAKRAFEAPELAGPAGRTLGKVYWELNQTTDAVRTWRVARTADPATVPEDDFIRALERAIEVSEKEADPQSEYEFRTELAELAPDHPEATEAQRFAAQEKLAALRVREGEYEEAVTLYEQLSEKSPDQSSYPFERGRLLARLGEDKRAISAFEEYVALGDAGSKQQRLQDVATRAETIGAFSVAVYFYEAALKDLPDEPSNERARLHRRVGGLLLSTGIKDAGEVHIRAYVSDMVALSKKPPSAEVYISAASVATSNRHPELALELLEEAITDAEPNWRASRRLAELYAQRGRTQDVERVLRTYVDRAGPDSNPKLTVGEWAASRRNFELARYFLEASVNENKTSDPGVWLQLARVYSVLGYMDEVRRSLNNYTAKSKDKRRAYVEVAAIYRAQRMYDEAEKALKAARKLDANDLLIVKLMEELYREWGRPNKVHEVYDAWAKARGNKADDLQLIGERFFRQQEFDDALPYLTRAANAGEHDAWLQIADIYNRQRKERDMKDALNNYLKNATNRPRALNAVLQRFRMSNWNHEAIPILEELIALEPTNLLHYEQLSQLYFQQGRDVEAFELWKRFISLADNPIAALETMARRFQRAQHLDWMLQFLHQVLERDGSPDPRIYRLLGDTYADLWTTRRRRVNPDVIFTQENKAKQYYMLYLEKGSPTRGELQTFAEAMRQKNYWGIAGKAYSQLESGGDLHPHQVLNYAIVLLNLGEVQQAEEMFAKFYQERRRTVEAALAVSDQLFSARRYDAAEPYLLKILREGNEDALLRQAFMKLAELYRNSDRPDEIPGLIASFLERAQDPREARRNIQMMLEASGMWAEAADQLETTAELQEEAGYELGANLYRAGKYDQADDAFRDYAANNLNQAAAWNRVGEFYSSRGEVDKAQSAFQNSVTAAPTSEAGHIELGRYLIETGRVDEGRAAMERARSKLQVGERGRVFRVEVEALTLAGELGAAREAAREAIPIAYLDRDYFYSVLAPTELSSGDPVRSQRMMDELSTASLPLEAVVNMLRDAGYIEQAAALIDKEIVSGDHILGASVLVSNADMFGQLGGIDRLMRSAQPLLEGANRDVNFPTRLGQFLVQEGHIAEGAMLLRRAVDQGADPRLAAALAGIYATMGQHGEAFEMLQMQLATSSDSIQRELALASLGYRYEVLGNRARFHELLEHLARDERFATEATPFLLRYLTEDGDVALVVDTVERATALAPADGGLPRDDRARDIAIATLVAGVEELAAGGYEQEALSLLASAPAELSEVEEVQDLRLRMAAFAGGQDVSAEFQKALDGLGNTSEDANQKLRVAGLAMTAGRYKLSRTIAEPLIESPEFNVAARAMRLTLRAARASNDLEGIDGAIDRFIAATPDRVGARSAVQSELTELGLDERALKMAEQQAERIPIYAHVREALLASQRHGDPKRIAKWAKRFKEVDRQNPIVALHQTLYTWTLRQEDHLNQPLREMLSGTFDHTLFGNTITLVNLYRQGRPYEAREQLLEGLDDVDFDPARVEHILGVLYDYKLYGEVAKVVAPKVPSENLTIPSQRLIGLSNLAMGFDADGLRQLDKTVEAAPDAAVEAVRIADALLFLRRYDSALRFATTAVQRRPTRPDGLRVRGLARLAVKDAEAAKEDLEAASMAGLNRGELLHRAAIIALRTGQDDLAEGFLDDLMLSHGSTEGIQARRVMDAFLHTGRGADGVDYVEKSRPRIASGDGIAGSEFVASLSQLYEKGGQPQRSYDVYEHGIRRLQFNSPMSSQLATYRNNLAYGFSTTNQNIDEGLDLVRRAIAQAPSREASYIDTLGWLHYRQGEYTLAESEIRRAIRSSSGGREELNELYHHLAVLRAVQGYHGQSVWYQMFADSVLSPSD